MSAEERASSIRSSSGVRGRRREELRLTSDGDLALDDGDESPPPPPPPLGAAEKGGKKERRSLAERMRGLLLSSTPSPSSGKTKKQLAKEQKAAEERRREEELQEARRRERDKARENKSKRLAKKNARAKPKLEVLLRKLDDEEDEEQPRSPVSTLSAAAAPRRRRRREKEKRGGTVRRSKSRASAKQSGGGASSSKQSSDRRARMRGAQTPRPSRSKPVPLQRSGSARALSEAGSALGSSDDSDDTSDSGGAMDARRALFPKALTEQERRRNESRRGDALGPLRPRNERFPYPPPRPGGSGYYRGAVGLRNLGNTCFMNACLQCLCSLPPLIEYFRGGAYEGHINTRLSPLRGQLAKDFGGLMLAMRRGEDGSVERPVAVKRTVSMIAPRFAGYGQQDVQEFLQFLLDGLSDDLNRLKKKPEYVEIKDGPDDSDRVKSDRWWSNYLERNDSFVSDLFAGQLKSEVVCMSCRHVSTAFDPFWNISVPIPKSSRNSTGFFRSTASCSLMECFEAFTEPELLSQHDQYYCSRCKKHRDSQKQLSLYRFPHILVVHIKRFGNASIMSRAAGRAKLTTNIEFPLEGLDLGHLSPPNHPQEALYDLVAVANHTGSLGGGHYTAFSKVSDRDWCFFNDSRCQLVSAKSIPGPAAYVLFYERRSTAAK